MKLGAFTMSCWYIAWRHHPIYLWQVCAFRKISGTHTHGIPTRRRSGGEEEEDDNRFMKVELWLASCFCMSRILSKRSRGVDRL